MLGLFFKGFYVSAIDDPSMFNGHKYYNATFSDGVQDYVVALGQDGRGELNVKNLVLFDKLYDGTLKFNGNKLSLETFEESKLKDPVRGLAFSGLRCSSKSDYVYENEEGLKYYSAFFSDGRQTFNMSCGADQAGAKLRDSLVTRSVSYEGTLNYLDIHRKKGGDVRLLCITSLSPEKKS